MRQAGKSLHLTVGADKVLESIHPGDSIAVNGVCLTVVRFDAASFTADVMPETYDKTNLRSLVSGSPVNLERTMAAGDRFGGHIVQGHVDGVGTIRSLEQDEIAVWVAVAAPPEVLRYVVPKGSVAIDGISLTVVDVGEDQFRVSLIPHTRAMTTMKHRRAGDLVNLEVDILAKYVEAMLARRFGPAPAESSQPKSRITPEFLTEHGF